MRIVIVNPLRVPRQSKRCAFECPVRSVGLCRYGKRSRAEERRATDCKPEALRARSAIELAACLGLLADLSCVSSKSESLGGVGRELPRVQDLLFQLEAEANP